MKNTHRNDAASSHFWKDNDRFADLFNTVLFEGKPVIDPRQLQEADAKESVVVNFEHESGKMSGIRDVVMKSSGKSGWMILGIENQSAVHLAMPLRTRLADDLSYQRQMRELQREHERKKDLEGSVEYLSKMKRREKLKAVMTVVVYYGNGQWDGPRKLSEMVAVPKELERYFQDYELVIVEAGNQEGVRYGNQEVQEFMELMTDLNQKSKEEILAKYRGKKLNEEVMWTVGEVTGTKLMKEMKEEKEEGRMLRIFEIEHNEGVKEGKRIGAVALIRSCLRFKKSYEETKQCLVEEFELSDENAERLMKENWKHVN